MIWLNSHRRSAVLVGITLAVPLYLFLSALVGLLEVRADYQSQIDAIEPRLARMQGLVAGESDIGRRLLA